jgi:formyl-CoA transferase
MSIKDIFEDPHYRERGNIIEVGDQIMGPVKMPGVTPRFSRTPGRVKFSGPKLGQFNEEVYGGLLKYSPEKLDLLRQEKVI